MFRFSIILIFSLFLAFITRAQSVDPFAVDGEIHIKVNSSLSFDLDGYTGGNLTFDLLFNASGLDSIYKPFPMANTELDSIYRVVFPNAAQVNVLIPALNALPFVEYAEKNPIVSEFLEPNDFQTNQWYLHKIQAQTTWDFNTGNSNVVVAVIDDAIAIDHQDLSANVYQNAAESGGFPLIDDDLNGQADDVNGYDVANGDANPRPPSNATGNDDGFAHGTHVAGIVSAATNNNTGIASLGFNTTILPVKIADDASGALTGSLDGVFYAMRSGVDIINMSWGTNTDAAALKAVISQASSAGITLIAAAGNDGSTNPFYPAAYPEVISVGATNPDDFVTGFSNYGNTIDVMAPGSGIYSTLPEGNNTYGNLSGTSMAAPLVSALAALLKAENANYSPQEIKQRIQAGCEDIDAMNPNYAGQIGAGRINAFNTVGNVSVSSIEKLDLLIYPNPTPDFINFQGTKFPMNAMVEIIDGLGRSIFQQPFQSQISVRELPSGIYTITIATEENRYNTKIIKE